MKKNLKNLLIGAGLVAAGAAAITALYRSTLKQLMEIALDRQEPKSITKNKKRLMGDEDAAKMMESLNEKAEELKKIGCETVEISGRDGVPLVGHWKECEAPKRVVIAMHGWRSNWAQDFGAIAPFWFKHGCCVLFAEQRAQGESGGEYMGFGLLERYDCLEWIHWVNERTNGNLPIYLGGVSMGASTVLMTAGFDLPENVRGIVADCGFTSPHAIWKHVVENNLHLPYGIYRAAANDICRKRLQLDSDDYSCPEAMKVCKVPVLFIHGTDDKFVPIEMTYQNYKACEAPKRLFVVPGAEHGMSYLIDQIGYEQEILRFWQET